VLYSQQSRVTCKTRLLHASHSALSVPVSNTTICDTRCGGGDAACVVTNCTLKFAMRLAGARPQRTHLELVMTRRHHDLATPHVAICPAQLRSGFHVPCAQRCGPTHCLHAIRAAPTCVHTVIHLKPCSTAGHASCWAPCKAKQVSASALGTRQPSAASTPHLHDAAIVCLHRHAELNLHLGRLRHRRAHKGKARSTCDTVSHACAQSRRRLGVPNMQRKHSVGAQPGASAFITSFELVHPAP
jgi:hypothetical protein